MTKDEAMARHPAGKQRVVDAPRVAVLERVREIAREHYWLYGSDSEDAPGRVERWDVRSVLDYVLANHKLASKEVIPTTLPQQISYATFYRWRSETMDVLLKALSDLVDDNCSNWGDWRSWEVEKERTYMDIEKVLVRAIEIARGQKK